jgi:hypothetical protein
LKTTPTDEKTLRSLPPQVGQTLSASSVNFWTASRGVLHSVHTY